MSFAAIVLYRCGVVGEDQIEILGDGPVPVGLLRIFGEPDNTLRNQTADPLDDRIVRLLAAERDEGVKGLFERERSRAST